MFLLDFIFALIIGLALASIFTLGFGRRGPWSSFGMFFLVVFLAAWLGGIWARPVGPPISGLYWMPFVFVGLLIALLLAAASPPPRPAPGHVHEGPARETLTAIIALEAFFWIWVAALLILIVTSYIWW